MAVLGDKGAQRRGDATDHRWRAALGEQQGGQLLVQVAQSARIVQDQHAFGPRHVEQDGIVQVVGINWWILAHQYHVELTQRRLDGGAEFEPAGRIVADDERRKRGDGSARDHAEAAWKHI